MTTTTCPICGTGFTPIRRQRFCRPACRQTAYRRAHQPAATPPASLPVTRHRKEITIYQCDKCEQRYLAEQWCHDCNRPCTRIGPGGACPSCDEPIAVEDLLPTPQDPDTSIDTDRQPHHAH